MKTAILPRMLNSRYILQAIDMICKNGFLRMLEVTPGKDINIPSIRDKKIYTYSCTLEPVFARLLAGQYIYIINIIYKIYIYMEFQGLRAFGMQWYTDNTDNNGKESQ